MPALVNSSVGSPSGTTLEDGTKVWPCFLQKKSMNCWRISVEVSMVVRILNGLGVGNETNRQRAAPAHAAVCLDSSSDNHDQLECPQKEHNADVQANGDQDQPVIDERQTDERGGQEYVEHHADVEVDGFPRVPGAKRPTVFLNQQEDQQDNYPRNVAAQMRKNPK